jgi:hypothetical protein
VQRAVLVLVGIALMALLVAAPAQAAIPYTEVTFFSDVGHSVGAGHEWRWTSDEEEMDAYVLGGNRLTVEVGPKFDAEVKHWFEFFSEPGTPFRTGVFRVPDSYPLFDTPGKPGIWISEYVGSSVFYCPYHSWGAYEVRDLVVGADGKVQRAWILYEQRCNRDAYGAFGEIRIGMPRTQPLATMPSMVRWPAYDAGHAATPAPVRVYAAEPVVATRVIGDDASAFQIDEDGCSGAGAGACDVRVRYGTPAPGTHRAWLAIDDAAGRRTYVPLQGFSYGGVTSLDVVSEPGDFVGQGGTYHYGPEVDYYFDSELPSHLAGWVADGLWGFAFDAPGRQQLVPGYYANAVRWDDVLPELDIGYATRGCNETSGDFTVHELVRGQGVEIRSFAISFVQQCDGSPGLLRGTLKHRSGDTTPDPPWMTTSAQPTDPGTPPGATPTPSPTPTATASPTATATPTPSPTPTATASPTPTATTTPSPAATATASQWPGRWILAPAPSFASLPDVAAPRVRLVRGTRALPVWLTLSEPAIVTTTLRRGGRAIRRAFTLAAGRHALTARRLTGRRRLARGRYKLIVRARDAAGNATPARVLRFTL